MKRGLPLLVVVSALVALNLFQISCFSANTRNLYSDISTSGFLSGDCYQSILEFPPDADVQGLVKQRENSINKAQSSKMINWLVLERLVEYSADRILSSNGPDLLKKGVDINLIKGSLRDQLRGFLDYGKVEYTYFREDNTAMVVHRIYRKELRKRLDSIEVVLDDKK